MAENNGAEIARAYVLVVPSLQGAQKELTKELVPEAEEAAHEAGTKGGEKFKAAMGAAAKAAAATMAAAVAASVKLIKESLDAYAETEQLQGGIFKLFGDEAGLKVIEASAQAYKTAGLSANDYMKQVTGISAALLKSGISADEAAQKADEAMRQIADNANTFGRLSAEELGEVYSALARGSYQVLDQLSLGYAGTKTGLSQLIQDANAYARATGRAADLTADNFADIVTAIGLIQEKSGIAGTTVMEAEQTIAGSLSMLSASWQNFIAGLGDPNADIDQLVTNVLSSLSSVEANILPTIQRIVQSVTKALPEMVHGVAQMIPVVLPDLLNAVVTLATSIAAELPGILESLITVIVDNAEQFVGAAIDIALALVEAVPRILDALAPSIPQIVGDVTASFVEHIPDFVTAAIDIVTGLVEHIPEIIVGLLNEVPNIVGQLATTFKDEENQKKMIDAGIALAKALGNAMLTTLVPFYGRIQERSAAQAWAAQAQANYTPIDTSGLGALQTETTTVNIETMHVRTADDINEMLSRIKASKAMG